MTGARHASNQARMPAATAGDCAGGGVGGGGGGAAGSATGGVAQREGGGSRAAATRAPVTTPTTASASTAAGARWPRTPKRGASAMVSGGGGTPVSSGNGGAGSGTSYASSMTCTAGDAVVPESLPSGHATAAALPPITVSEPNRASTKADAAVHGAAAECVAAACHSAPSISTSRTQADCAAAAPGGTTLASSAPTANTPRALVGMAPTGTSCAPPAGVSCSSGSTAHTRMLETVTPQVIRAPALTLAARRAAPVTRTPAAPTVAMTNCRPSGGVSAGTNPSAAPRASARALTPPTSATRLSTSPATSMAYGAVPSSAVAEAEAAAAAVSPTPSAACSRAATTPACAGGSRLPHDSVLPSNVTVPAAGRAGIHSRLPAVRRDQDSDTPGSTTSTATKGRSRGGGGGGGGGVGSNGSAATCNGAPWRLPAARPSAACRSAVNVDTSHGSSRAQSSGASDTVRLPQAARRRR